MSITSNENSPSNANQQGQKSGTWQQVKTVMRNCKSRTAYASKNTQEGIKIQQLQLSIAARKKSFGMEYMDLMLEKDASPEELQACADKAATEISQLVAQLNACQEHIALNKEKLERKIATRKGVVNHTQPEIHVTPSEDSGAPETAPTSNEETVAENSNDIFSRRNVVAEQESDTMPTAEREREVEPTGEREMPADDDDEPEIEMGPFDEAPSSPTTGTNEVRPTPSAPFEEEINVPEATPVARATIAELPPYEARIYDLD
ncbi:expressed unknown protein [Seminavis robusta]|uniref:Uncharacterized protein n=1 Tax=Seminavis robusta TaxID=568900 RepID=A0A9N8EU83_9STRA|nr:expressed unknown protein [Seminavis robusta]|eukprot:Sro1703_g292330.1 n/a (262) ;mRNA; r:22531-23316